jgi:hypothetical protein
MLKRFRRCDGTLGNIHRYACVGSKEKATTKQVREISVTKRTSDRSKLRPVTVQLRQKLPGLA